MNPKEFFDYVEAKYTINFAKFLCEDLHIVNQSIMINMSLTDILEMSRSVFPRVQSTSVNYYVVDSDNKNSAKELHKTALTIIKLLKKELNLRHNKRKGMLS
jgi:hypothetical protein